MIVNFNVTHSFCKTLQSKFKVCYQELDCSISDSRARMERKLTGRLIQGHLGFPVSRLECVSSLSLK